MKKHKKIYTVFRVLSLIWVASGMVSGCAKDLPDQSLILASALIYQQTTSDRVNVEIEGTGSAQTSEGGTTTTINVTLETEPRADVNLSFSSSDATEGILDVTDLHFTRDNYNIAQTINVTGVDDAERDGDTEYFIQFDPIQSQDTHYSGKIVAPFTMVNVDDEDGKVLVSSVSGNTTEGGGTASFTLTLNRSPSAPVTISVSSSSPTEATVSPASVVLDSTSWDTGVSVIITGVDDAVSDGDQTVTIQLAAATSSDPAFSGYDPSDITILNVDNESGGAILTNTDIYTLESDHASAGTSGEIRVRLSSAPTGDVKVCLEISNACEGMVVPGAGNVIAADGSCSPDVPYLLFTSANYTMDQQVLIRGQHDYEVAGCTGPYPDHNKGYSLDLTGSCPTCTGDSTVYNGYLGSSTLYSQDDKDLYTYVTALTHTGDFEGDPGLGGVLDTNPFPEMDQFCAVAKPFAVPNGVTYKAMATDGVNRSTTVDWVFIAGGKYYYREDGTTLMFISDASGTTAFPLTASFGSGTGFYWTGLDNAWNDSLVDCNFWDSSAPGDSGNSGLESATDGSSIGNSSDSCNQLRSLVCVQQNW